MKRILVGVAAVFVACEPAPGTPGAKVWFASSAYLEATHAAGSTFPGSSWSSTECVRLTREELSREQLAYLESLTLERRTPYCISDGWEYSQLVVGDSSGPPSTYTSHEAGKCGEKVDGGVELNFDFSVFADAGTSCH